MGMISPKSGKHCAIVRTLTSDFKPAKTADTVVGWELSDGTQVFKEEYEAFRAAREKIVAEYETSRAKLLKDFNAKQAALLASVQQSEARGN